MLRSCAHRVACLAWALGGSVLGSGCTETSDPIGTEPPQVAAVSQGGSGSANASTGSGGATTAAGGDCGWEIEDSLSTAIATVGVVQWSAELDDLSDARIDFQLLDPTPGELNTASGGPISVAPPRRALMLGLKPERSYSYRIRARSGSLECVSPARTLTTGPVPEDAPRITRQALIPMAQAKGFIITCPGFNGVTGPALTYILDADGELVWWAPANASCSRARMNFEASDMWSMAVNPANDGGGQLRRVSMDGTELEVVDDLPGAHHDFAVLPGGVLGVLAWHASGDDPPSAIVERSLDGSLSTVAVLDERVYRGDSGKYHANSLEYHPLDNSYTVGDYRPTLFVKIARDSGQVRWQFGGSCVNAPAARCAAINSFGLNHGHQLLDGERLLFFANESKALEYQLAESDSSLSATVRWSHEVQARTPWLGDVQRLPNGNTLLVVSDAGEMYEVTSENEVVQVLVAAHPFGYAHHRESLYGPPSR